MPLLLGLDTGGTYTDAVLYDPERGVMAAAKALTTKHDLALGVRQAIEQIIPSRAQARDIGLVSLSTTLATNAIVERHRSPICLILLGYDAGSLERAGLRDVLAGDPVVFVRGGHTATGDEQEPLDLAAARQAVLDHAGGVAAFAVSGFFSVRNPAHEHAVRALVRELTGRPVTCGHELTSRLDAPRRALTTALNARLIPQLHQLVQAVADLLSEHGIHAPLMVVKGDGSLMGASVALGRPVETILSGPAASVVGAHHLSGADDVFVVDMGGTTTDIALLRGGRPVLSSDGATVAGWRTMVEAVGVHTFGLGGDSEVGIDQRGELAIGPRRLVPLSLLAHQHPDVIGVLAAQAEADPDSLQGRFALRQRPLDTGQASLTAPQARLWQALGNGPVALTELGASYVAKRALLRLVDRGLVVVAGLTPSDAAHLLGYQDSWSVEAARFGADLFARRLSRDARQPELNGESLCRRILDQVAIEAGRAVLTTALAESAALDLAHAGPVARWLVDRALAGPASASTLVDPAITLRRPLVAVGAPVTTYYPTVAERLHTRLIIPDHAAVSNAVGAVAGGIVQTVKALITAPSDGRYRVHLPIGVADFADLEAAVAHAVDRVRRLAEEQAIEAGAASVEVQHRREDRIIRETDGAEIFIEVRIAATATGRPRLAVGDATP